MTRWHQDDLAGRILAEEKLSGIKEWEVMNFPVLANDNDILGRKEGEALWPQRYPADVLLNTKREVGSRVWSALYQGEPQDPENQKFKRDWFKYYDNLPKEIVRRGAGADTATSLKSVNDNTSLVDVCRDAEGFLYVDDCFCEKISVSGFARHLSNQHKIKKYSKVKLEKNNAGEAFKQRIDEVAREESVRTGMPVAIPVECEQTSTDKMVRAMEFQALVENGTLRFRRGHAKVAELIEHLINFDGQGGDVDDDVDALGFAIKAVISHNEANAKVATWDTNPVH
jgi:predicted phage terminase large subunit-like protein